MSVSAKWTFQGKDKPWSTNTVNKMSSIFCFDER